MLQEVGRLNAMCVDVVAKLLQLETRVNSVILETILPPMEANVNLVQATNTLNLALVLVPGVDQDKKSKETPVWNVRSEATLQITDLACYVQTENSLQVLARLNVKTVDVVEKSIWPHNNACTVQQEISRLISASANLVHPTLSPTLELVVAFLAAQGTKPIPNKLVVWNAHKACFLMTTDLAKTVLSVRSM